MLGMLIEWHLVVVEPRKFFLVVPFKAQKMFIDRFPYATIEETITYSKMPPRFFTSY